MYPWDNAPLYNAVHRTSPVSEILAGELEGKKYLPLIHRVMQLEIKAKILEEQNEKLLKGLTCQCKDDDE